MALKAKKADPVAKRLKLFMFGDYGVGKTTAAIQFPQAYVFDCERGTDNYADTLNASNSVRLQTVSAEEVIEELRALQTERHDYRTVIIDPITTLESDIVERANQKYDATAKEGGDMRVWRDRDATMKRIANLIFRLDMNIIMTAHGKVDYGPNMTKLGMTFDGWKRLPYMFDLVLELKREGTDRVAHVKKTRIKEFTDGEKFGFDYAEILRRCGAILEKDATPLVLATAEQVAELTRLLEIIKLPDGTTDKWLQKAGVDVFADMPSDAIAKCITFVKSKLTTTDTTGKDGN